ncbi:rhodanese-like domain-containing protein [Marinithermus hydrothermalis]|uniref:Rhodanese-like protein n=1 Tax=Marinithermus hydrothermalis (strain DSM 14884 / JCM 11576 / T1) TaxID=869210 RepID=F2NQS1_MARHT|nr:rhodanese-like domain-containing protein [Marinithermus hydrothermalis]AEB12285.1 Rhodanese-like protein [Marinithermus hydrothermalis DSM 14884]
MKTVTPETLPEVLALNPVIVDVRPPERFAHGSLDGAVNLPLERIQQGDHDLPKDRPLLLVCQIGRMSELAALYLEAEGYTEVYNLAGGLDALGLF